MPERLRLFGWLICAGLTAGYLVLFAQLDSLPFQDLPNHLARAVVMGDLMFHHGARFGEVFEYRLMPLPYVLSDLFLVGAVEVFGAATAAIVWTAIAFLSLPAALLFHLHVNKVRVDARLLVFALSLYLATDWFFVMGFVAFRLSIALLIVALALADLMRERPAAWRYAIYAAVIVIGYLVHLGTIVFLIPALVTSSLLRLWFGSTTMRRELLLVAPVMAVLVWQVVFAGVFQQQGDLPGDPLRFRDLATKLTFLTTFNWELMRFGGPAARLMMLLLAVCVVVAVATQVRMRTLARPAVVEMLAIAGAYLAMYFVLPSAYQDGSYLDVRALVLITLFLLLACVQVRESSGTLGGRSAAIALAIAMVLAAVNLGYLARHLTTYDAWADRYRAVVAAVPRGAFVLPVHTLPRERTVRPFLHMPSYLVTDRAAVSPYLFSGDRATPMKYFRYKRRAYTPVEWWYQVSGAHSPVEWGTVACTYDYLLVTKPFQPRDIKVPTRLAAQNETAALLQVLRAGGRCRPAAPAAARPQRRAPPA